MMQQQQEAEQQSPFAAPSTDILECMRKQEKSYVCQDYLHQEDGNVRQRLALPQSAINVACRTSMMQWMQTVVNFIGFDPETVEIAMSYLDRFLTTAAGQEAIHCRTIYQLAAMTALYTAVKINCAEALTPKLLAELSQGAYEADQFEEMERILLEAIQWRVTVPTSASFVRETLEILPQSLFCNEETLEAVQDMARVQAEFAIGDFDLLTVKRSVIAFAAVHNSLRSNGIRFNLAKYLQQNLEGHNLDLDVKQATMVQKTLRSALPSPSSAAEEEDLMDTSMLSHASELGDESVKSIDDHDDHVPHKRISAGKSPRSVICRNVAA